MFINPNGPDGKPGTEDDDLRLKPGSPCIDKGDANALPADSEDLDSDGDTTEPIPLDLAGKPRISGAGVDMGAYEVQAAVGAAGQLRAYTEWPFDAAEAKRRQAETAKALGVKVEETLDLGKGVTMKLVLIPAGTFVMGSPETETERMDTEGPRRQVTISKPFYMGVYEVTQAQYESVVGKNISKFKGPQNPVELVFWSNATAFCAALSMKTGRVVGLPTEAQWEYACRARTETSFSFGDNAKDLYAYAWYEANSAQRTHPVGQKKPNAFGLYDMHGNVMEWCHDWYAWNFYAKAKNVDPENTAETRSRVVRGGAWNTGPRDCRSARRYTYDPDTRGHQCGFRVVLAPGSGTN